MYTGCAENHDSPFLSLINELLLQARRNIFDVDITSQISTNVPFFFAYEYELTNFVEKTRLNYTKVKSVFDTGTEKAHGAD